LEPELLAGALLAFDALSRSRKAGFVILGEGLAAWPQVECLKRQGKPVAFWRREEDPYAKATAMRVLLAQLNKLGVSEEEKLLRFALQGWDSDHLPRAYRYLEDNSRGGECGGQLFARARGALSAQHASPPPRPTHPHSAPPNLPGSTPSLKTLRALDAAAVALGLGFRDAEEWVVDAVWGNPDARGALVGGVGSKTMGEMLDLIECDVNLYKPAHRALALLGDDDVDLTPVLHAVGLWRDMSANGVWGL
jgi:hypothetical protein